MDAQTLRFECLKLAASMLEGRSQEEILISADALFQWCSGMAQVKLRVA